MVENMIIVLCCGSSVENANERNYMGLARSDDVVGGRFEFVSTFCHCRHWYRIYCLVPALPSLGAMLNGAIITFRF
jgi:hypothetical protein